MHTIIRLAGSEDAASLQAIYAPFCGDSAVSFEIEPPSAVEMGQRVSKTLAHLPWLVCERDGDLLGYVCAHRHRERAAYQWSVEVSAYVHARSRRSGVGRALYTSLFAGLVVQGFYNAYAGITLPNPGSVGLHESHGFRPVGVYHHVGYKIGAWHDVGWWSLELQPTQPDPAPPRSLPQVVGTPAWQLALTAGLRHLRV